VLGLYKGWGITIFGLAPFVGIKFAVFDTLKSYVTNRKGWKTMIMGATAGAVALSVTYPTELLKRRM
jgi:solute carrier family 25 phosphate transporter 23/24/25/41